MSIARVCAALAVLASILLPLFVRADPSQPAATGFFLPAGTPLELILEQQVDSSATVPGTVVQLHLRQALAVNGRIVAPAGSKVALTVAETRRASPGVDGAMFVHLGSLKLAEGGELPLALPHYDLNRALVSAARDEIAIPVAGASASASGDLVLPAGTAFRATTAASIDASDAQKIVVVTPPPFAVSTDRPYSAFTPIPITTYAPFPMASRRPRGRRGRPAPTPSPSSSPSPSPSPA